MPISDKKPKPSGIITVPTLQAGDRAQVVQDCHQYRNPQGLATGAIVTCVASEPGYWTVRCDDGREFSVSRVNLKKVI